MRTRWVRFLRGVLVVVCFLCLRCLFLSDTKHTDGTRRTHSLSFVCMQTLPTWCMLLCAASCWTSTVSATLTEIVRVVFFSFFSSSLFFLLTFAHVR